MCIQYYQVRIQRKWNLPLCRSSLRSHQQQESASRVRFPQSQHQSVRQRGQLRLLFWFQWSRQWTVQRSNGSDSRRTRQHYCGRLGKQQNTGNFAFSLNLFPGLTRIKSKVVIMIMMMIIISAGLEEGGGEEAIVPPWILKFN